MPLKITLRNNGPLAVDLTTGDLQLVDHEGNVVPLPEGKTTITLCRCGASTRKPFCDGTHSKIGFKGANDARAAFDAANSTGPGGTAAPTRSAASTSSPAAPVSPASPAADGSSTPKA